MSELARLEAVLQARWDDATAAVYADALIARGDLRGELIALDLFIARHGRSAELVVRKDERLRAWLGEHAWADAGFGLTRTAVSSAKDAAALARAPIAPYLRALTVYDHDASLETILERLAELPLPWLQRLELHKHRRGPAVTAATVDALAAAAPHIEELVLDGRRVIALPANLLGVRRLRLVGAAALAGTAALPHVEELELALWDDAAFAPSLGKPARIAADVNLSRFPALARLDLARNEGPVSVYRLAAAFDELDRVAQLRAPALRSDADVQIALELLARHPRLELRVARMYGYAPPAGAVHPRLHVPPPRPWPSRDDVAVRSGLLVPQIDLGDTYLGLANIIEALEARFDAMPAAARAAWAALWQFLDGLPWAEDHGDEPVLPFDAAMLLTALDAIRDDDVPCELYADALRALALPAGATAGIQRYWSG